MVLCFVWKRTRKRRRDTLLVFQTAVYNEMSEQGLMTTHQEVRYLTIIMVQHITIMVDQYPVDQISIGELRDLTDHGFHHPSL